MVPGAHVDIAVCELGTFRWRGKEANLQQRRHYKDVIGWVELKVLLISFHFMHHLGHNELVPTTSAYSESR